MTANEKEMPKISIIVPVYNAAGTLDRCMRGLLAQTWRNLEILLMDDGSDDGSPALCDRYAAEDPRVRAVHLAHGGVAGARNAALSLYTGDFLMFADADDLVDIHYAEYLYDALLAGGTDLAYCHAFDCKDTPPDNYAIAPVSSVFSPVVLNMAHYDFTDWTSHRVIWGAIYKKELLAGLSFSEKYAVSTDTLFIAQVLHRCKTVTYLPVPLYCYVFVQNSVSNRSFDRKRYDDIRVWEEVARLFADTPGRAAPSAKIHLTRKRMVFLRHMTMEGSKDTTLRKELLPKIRLRYRAVFYKKAPAKQVLRELLYVTFPEFYLFLVRRRHR